MSVVRFTCSMLLAAALAGCQAITPAPPSAADAVARYDGPTARTALTIELRGAARSVQWVPSYAATYIQAEVSGAGLNGWVPLAPVDGTTGYFDTPDAQGNRVATLTALAPAGERRVFRVRVYQAKVGGDVLLETLWGVRDLPANTVLQQAWPYTISRLTTPVGQIFHKLLQVNAAQALKLPVLSVQHLVERLINTNAVTGAPWRANSPRISYALLDIDKTAAAIIRGNNGLPFQIPEPIPVELLQPDAADPTRLLLPEAMRIKGQVRVRVLDIQGRTVERPLTFYVSDPASPIQQAAVGAPADVTLSEVAPGTWAVHVSDMEKGLGAAAPVVVSANQLAGVSLTLKPTAERIAGSYDQDKDLATSFDGDNTPARMAFFNGVTAVAGAGSVVYVLDNGNGRLRRFDINDPQRVVTTLAKVSGSCLTVGPGGALFVASGRTVQRVAPDGTVTNFWTPTSSAYDGMMDLAYDASTNDLFVGCTSPTPKNVYRLDLDVYNPATPTSLSGANGISKPGVTYGTNARGLAAGGGFLFVGSEAAGQKSVIQRLEVGSGTVTSLVGITPAAAYSDAMPATHLSENGVRGLALDGLGNMFFRANGGLYRVKGTTGAGATVTRAIGDVDLETVGAVSGSEGLLLVSKAEFLNAAGTSRKVPIVQRLVP